jgi:hypothetical protein
MQWSLPLLPLVLDSVPPGLVLALRQEGVPVIEVSQMPQGAWAARRSGIAAKRRGAAESPPGRFLLYDSRTNGHASAAQARRRHQCPLDVDALRRGWPFDPFDALVDTRSTRAGWDVEGHLLAENVSYYPKAEIRRKLLRVLRHLLETQGGIWLRLSAYPYPYRSVFNVRVDHDEYDAREFAAVLEQLKGHEHAASHYVCASAFDGQPHVLGSLADFDVGSHGWWHHTYRDGRQNRENIRRGIETLKAAGLTPNGFVAPHGRWNAGLDRALEELGIEHSSEFGLAHDDVPFFPYLGPAKRGAAPAPGAETTPADYSSVLQLPVHPVCLGLFLEAGVDDARLIERYFAAVVRTKYQRGEPILLYGHPTGRLGRWPGVLQTIFASAAQFQLLWQTTLSRFAAWWRRRQEVTFAVYPLGDGYEVRMQHSPKSWRLALEYWRGDHVALFPVAAESSRFRPDELAYELRRSAEQPSRRITLPRQARLKEHVRDWLDWEMVTPAEEIRIDTIPGMLKRGLRNLRRQPRKL